MRSSRRRLLVMFRNISAALLVVALLNACGGKSSGTGSVSSDIKSPYPKYTETTKTVSIRSGLGGATDSFTFARTGEQVIGGKTFGSYSLTGSGPTAGTAGGVGRIVDDNTIEVASAQVTSVLSSALGIVASAGAQFAAPVQIKLNPPVGEPQTLTLTGTATIGAGAQPEALSLPVTYTLTEKNVAVDTPGGRIEGCSHFTASGTSRRLFILPTEVAGDLWYSPTFGLVKAQMTKPIAGFGISFVGTSDAVELADGYASVHKVGVVGAGATSSTFTMSTYDRKQTFDADKNSHAKMLVEIRFADETAAKSSQKPFISNESYMFGTMVGSFPSSLTQSSVSVFHPEENGKGYTYWMAFVDEAAKNEPTNGIAYQLNVKYDSSFSAIRVSSRIIYKVLK